jgi:hypothetical protein
VKNEEKATDFKNPAVTEATCDDAGGNAGVSSEN